MIILCRAIICGVLNVTVVLRSWSTRVTNLQQRSFNARKCRNVKYCKDQILNISDLATASFSWGNIAKLEKCRCLCLQHNETPATVLKRCLFLFHVLCSSNTETITSFLLLHERMSRWQRVVHVKAVNSVQVWFLVPFETQISHTSRTLEAKMHHYCCCLSWKSVNSSVLFQEG